MFVNVKSLCSTPETNIILYVIYISKKRNWQPMLKALQWRAIPTGQNPSSFVWVHGHSFSAFACFSSLLFWASQPNLLQNNLDDSVCVSVCWLLDWASILKSSQFQWYSTQTNWISWSSILLMLIILGSSVKKSVTAGHIAVTGSIAFPYSLLHEFLFCFFFFFHLTCLYFERVPSYPNKPTEFRLNVL